jgi:Fe-S cluster assembly ATP-binding protein
VLFDGESILDMEPDERSRSGLFLAFQRPIAIPGVTVANFLRTAINARRKEVNPEDKGISIPEFRKLLTGKMNELKMDTGFAARYVGEGFSGGEMKRLEILQLATLQPKIAILDETDSGLDIDALRVVADGIKSLIGPELGVVVVTHYDQFLNYMKPEFVHVMYDGRIVEEGGFELAQKIQDGGYDWIAQKHAAVTA